MSKFIMQAIGAAVMCAVVNKLFDKFVDEPSEKRFKAKQEEAIRAFDNLPLDEKMAVLTTMGIKPNVDIHL